MTDAALTEAELRARIQRDLIRFIADVVLFNQVVAQRVGLTGSDSQFMTLLQAHGPMTPGELAVRSGLTTGTVTGVVDRLEQAGFVRRTRDQHDRRKVIVTPDQQVTAQRLYPHYEGQGRRLADVLAIRNAAELLVIADFLTDVLASGEHSGGTSGGGGTDLA